MCVMFLTFNDKESVIMSAGLPSPRRFDCETDFPLEDEWNLTFSSETKYHLT